MDVEEQLSPDILMRNYYTYFVKFMMPLYCMMIQFHDIYLVLQNAHCFA
jgi:hypothetical protein